MTTLNADAPETPTKKTRLDLVRLAYAKGAPQTCRLSRCGRPFTYDPEATTQFYCRPEHAVDAYIDKHPETFTADFVARRRNATAQRVERRAVRSATAKERFAALRAAGKIGARKARTVADPMDLDEAGATGYALKMIHAARALGGAGTAVTYGGKNAALNGKAGVVVGFAPDGAAFVAVDGTTVRCSSLSVTPVATPTAEKKTTAKKKKETR